MESEFWRFNSVIAAAAAAISCFASHYTSRIQKQLNFQILRDYQGSTYTTRLIIMGSIQQASVLK